MSIQMSVFETPRYAALIEMALKSLTIIQLLQIVLARLKKRNSAASGPQAVVCSYLG